MKIKNVQNTGFLTILLICLFTLINCSTKVDETYFKINPSFKPYIQGFTSGMVSTDVKISVKLNFDYADAEMLEKPCTMELFQTKPKIDGETYWINSHTVEFRPKNKLPHDALFLIDFHLNKILQVPDSLSTFKFHVRTMQQALEVHIVNVMPYDVDESNTYKYSKIIGEIKTADFADVSLIEKVLSVKSNSKYTLKWTHNSSKRQHFFEIDSVHRTTKSQILSLQWDGKPINATQKGLMDVQIPAASEFKMTAVKTVQAPDKEVIIQFSDPLDENQNLEGLIRFTGAFRYMIQHNELRVYPNNNIQGSQTITLEKAIKNTRGSILTRKEVTTVFFEDIKPAIKLTGNGVILPASEGLIFPFEAVNLKAVDVSIVKVFEDNILQFLQNNNFDGHIDKRVGRPIFNKMIELSKGDIVNYGQWHAYALKLDELIKTEPGALYQITISYKQNYSTYPCDESMVNQNLNDFSNMGLNDAGYDQNTYYYDYDDYYYDYNWYERNDPCKPSYYYNKKHVRNVLASDLGIIAKKGHDDLMHVYVNNMLTTKPLSNVKIEFYNLQQQLIYATTTNQDGKAVAKLPKTPYFIVAKTDKQKGYLKLDNNAALSLSMFDVTGTHIDRDVKGFLYGERGVWRPGDSLYLTFILEDKLDKLPMSHPIVFSLYNPMGQITYRTTKTNGLHGFYSFNCATHPDAPTGNWTATVDVGGSQFSKTLKIETVVPNRLKIEVDFGDDKLYAFQDNKIVLKSNWLHGAPASNLRADVKVSFSKSQTKFERFKDFIFDDPSKSFEVEEYEIFNGKLDEEGIAHINPEIKLEYSAPGTMRANFQIRVFENGGAFSIDRTYIPYFPYTSYVGLKVPKGSAYNNTLVTDKEHTIDIVNTDINGSLLSGKKAQVEVYKIDWNWWWDESEDNLSNYINSYYMSPVHEEEITLTNGRGSFKLRVDKPDWGRFFIRVIDTESTHSSGTFVNIDYPEWVNRSRMRETSAATLLSITSDKNFYNVGDPIEISFPSSDQGRALVSIEKGSRILNSFWVETQKGHTLVSFKATKDMTPNTFVYISYLQPHAQTKNDLPIRLYGVVPIAVEDKNTLLKPVIKMADVLKPEQKARINISEEGKKDMTYTIAIVDEGLLDLTRFKTPNPWTYFYAKEALSIRTWDMYDFVAGATAGKLRRLLNIGGDDEGTSDEPAKANRFKPMVKFLGPFYLPKGQNITHTFDMPQYVGSVRVMVVAGQNGAYGKTDKTVAVRNPLMILGTLPRVLGTDETVELPVSVFAMESFIKNVEVSIETNNLFTIEGAARKTVQFTKTGDKMVNFKLKTNKLMGVGTVKVVAKSGNQKAEYTIEIDVRNPNPKVTDVVEWLVEPGKTTKNKIKTIGINGTNKGILEVSSVPPINLDKRINYLIQYPHGCLEQTTSAAFPQLFLDNLIELNSNDKSQIQRNVKAAINKIASLQLSNGGIGYWPGAQYADEWASIYAGHFMIEASQKGYALPVNFLSNLIKYLKLSANAWQPTIATYYNSDLIQAYRLYVLALAKSPEMGAMNRMRTNDNLSITAKWRLAAAYSLAGQNQVAKRITNNLATKIQAYKELSNTYGSDLRDKAMILETLTLLGDKSKSALLVKDIATQLASDQWHSTQTTAYSLIALSQYFKKHATGDVMHFSFELPHTQGQYNGKSLISKFDLDFRGKSLDTEIKIQNKSQGLLFARIILEGIPEHGNEKASENDLKMSVKFKNTIGEDFSIQKIKQGQDFIAELSIANPGYKGHYKEMALSFIVPSGWEIHNTRMDIGESTLKMDRHNYIDFRDDRIYVYFNLAAYERKVFQFMFNAAYLGRFYKPALYCEAMYDATINAKIPGAWVEVIP